MTPGYVAVLGVGAAIGSCRPPPSRGLAIALGAVVALFVLLVAPGETLVTGTEGLLEALTAGILLALAARGVAAREAWMALPAGVLLAEELDWGQLLRGFPTPDRVIALGATSSLLQPRRARLAVGAAADRGTLRGGRSAGPDARRGRPAPAAALRRGPALGARRPRAPRLWPTVALAGGRRFDEASELALVLLVWACWERGASVCSTRAADPPRGGGPGGGGA